MVSPDESADESMGEALRLLRVPDDQRDTARDRIKNVARLLREDLASAEKAPRLADIKTRLPEAVQRAERLLEFLKSDLPYVAKVASGYDLMARYANPEHGEPAIPKVLSYNAQHLQSALGEFVEIIAPLAEEWPKDSGGGQNLWAMFNGSPKQVFAVRCWVLFTWFRPGEAANSETGEYHCFTECLYEIATDKHPSDDRAGLERYTKLTAKELNAADHNPNYESFRRASGDLHMELIEASSTARRIFKSPTRLYDRIMGRGRGEK